MPRAVKSAAPTAVAAGTNYPVIRDKAAIKAVEQFVSAKAEIDQLEAAQAARKALISDAMGGAPVANAGIHVITLTTVPPLPASSNFTITKEMIGQVVRGKKGRAGYTQIRIQ